jgi:hypothetical protein
MNEPSREPIHKPTKRLGQDALLPVNLSSKGGICHDKNSERVMFSNQGQDNEIQSDSTDSSNTQPSNWQGPKQRSLVISARVPFATFHSNLTSGLVYCWVHSHTGFESVTSSTKVSCNVFALLACELVYFISYQVVIPVPFISFRSKSFGLAYCWIYSHWKTTADLFQALHSIQFARIKRSFISARALISTFDGSTSSSRMAC